MPRLARRSVAVPNQGLTVRTHDGNLAATTLTLIKELCTAVANVPRATVVATLTSSNLEDYASLAGEEMQERLSKVVGRTENIVTPVEGDDIFPILHRRLFTSIGPEDERREVANAYADWYESLSHAVRGSYREAAFRDRIAVAYPFHPELVDILTNRWGSLSGFQRTRGALRTLAHTVKALSQRNHDAALIHPGDVVLADPGIRGEVLRFAGESYKAALNAAIIRPDAKAPEEDLSQADCVHRVESKLGDADDVVNRPHGLGALDGVGLVELPRHLLLLFAPHLDFESLEREGLPRTQDCATQRSTGGDDAGVGVDAVDNISGEYDSRSGYSSQDRGARSLERDNPYVGVEGLREDDEGASMIPRYDAEEQSPSEFGDGATDLRPVLELKGAHGFGRTVKTREVGQDHHGPHAVRGSDSACDLLG